MKVAILYDCMFPYTVGGAERWYVNVANRLQGHHEVTYVTLRQWDEGFVPDEPFEVVTVGPRLELYTESGRRRIGPPLRYGWGVFLHLLRHGRRYDVVHGASFPYFSVIGAWAALLFHPRTKLVIDWHEVWTVEYWKEYLGTGPGKIGFAVQKLCSKLPDHNFSFSKKQGSRLPQRNLTYFTGEFVEGERPESPGVAPESPHAVFAGRHIPEKQPATLPLAVRVARESVPALSLTIFGDGPERAAVESAIDTAGASGFVAVPGFVSHDEVHDAMRSASCMVLPSVREGYGLVVVESVSMGTPVVLIDGPDNAATELIEPGVNGFVAPSASPEDLGAAIVKAVEGGTALRESTWRWYEEHRAELSIDDSIEKIEAVYSEFG